MKIVDIPVGTMEFIVDETAGTVTFEIKGTILNHPEDFKFNVSLKDVLIGLVSGMKNPFAKWALGLIIGML